MSTAFHQKDNITARKKKHLEVCLDPDSSIEGSDAFFDHIEFIHNPIPELTAEEISLTDSFLGREVRLPFFISSMTGGSAEGFRANRNLVEAAQHLGIPAGLGSMRVLFYHPELKEHFAMKKLAPDIPLFGNLSSVQIAQRPAAEILELVKELELDALAVHLNPGQELYQKGGDRDFRDICRGIEKTAALLPVIVKETGFGIPPAAAEKLLNAGAVYIDVAGAGGTNWIRVEQQREDGVSRNSTFDSWGIPTAVNLASLTQDVYRGKILASGGLRTPLDFAKSIALGAVSAGTALPLIQKEQEGGVKAIIQYWEELAEDMKRIMLLTGCRTVEELRNAPLVLSREIIHYAKQLRPDTNWRRLIAE